MKRFFVAVAAFALAASVALAQDFSAAVELYNAGGEAINAGNKEEAIQQFKLAYAQFQGVTEGDEATQAAEKVADLKDLIPNIYISLSNDKVKESDFDGALATLAEAKAFAAEAGNEEAVAKVDDRVFGVYSTKGQNLLKAKDFAGAAAAFQEAVALKPDNGTVYLLLGQALSYNNEYDEAIAALEKASELGQEAKTTKLLSTTYLKKGQALGKAGKSAEAVEALLKSNEYVESASAYQLLNVNYTKLGKAKEAEAALKKYQELSKK